MIYKDNVDNNYVDKNYFLQLKIRSYNINQLTNYSSNTNTQETSIYIHQNTQKFDFVHVSQLSFKTTKFFCSCTVKHKQE